jgi:predicted DNA-binding WGR domain protein
VTFRNPSNSRVYALAFEQLSLFGESSLSVVWGRAGRALRRRVETFASERERARRVRALVRRRELHGYVPQ